jgi:BRCA1 C Terminus (BRCT) domain
MAEQSFLGDVVALLVCRAACQFSQKAVLASKLQSLGARVKSRWSKEVTHVIFQKAGSCNAADKAAQDEELRELLDKADQAGACIVSPVWLEMCIRQGKRANVRRMLLPANRSSRGTICIRLELYMTSPKSSFKQASAMFDADLWLFGHCVPQEKSHQLARPPAPILAGIASKRTPGSNAAKKRKRMEPKPAEAFDLDVNDALFSSTQLMEAAGTDDGEVVGSTHYWNEHAMFGC